MGPLALASEKMSSGHLLPAFWQAPVLLKTWQPPFRFPLFKFKSKKIIANAMIFYFGAGSGNRTHVSSLEGWGSTIELHLHLPLTVFNYKLFSFNCQYFFEIFLTFFFIWRKPPYSRGFQNTPNSKFINFINYALGFLIAACAAANLAIGTLNGEHDT